MARKPTPAPEPARTRYAGITDTQFYRARRKWIYWIAAALAAIAVGGLLIGEMTAGPPARVAGARAAVVAMSTERLIVYVFFWTLLVAAIVLLLYAFFGRPGLIVSPEGVTRKRFPFSSTILWEDLERIDGDSNGLYVVSGGGKDVRIPTWSFEGRQHDMIEGIRAMRAKYQPGAIARRDEASSKGRAAAVARARKERSRS